MIYFAWSMRYGRTAPSNPWGASGLEWQTSSPPPTENFEQTPVITEDPYTYSKEAPLVV
jgi:cytochrome c oxidase subunit 1